MRAEAYRQNDSVLMFIVEMGKARSGFLSRSARWIILRSGFEQNLDATSCISPLRTVNLLAIDYKISPQIPLF